MASNTRSGLYAMVKAEDPEDDVEIINQVPATQNQSIPAPGDQLAMETDFIANLNAKSAVSMVIPPKLHEYYCQISSRNHQSYFVCWLCSKHLKCRSARDMRDHALSHGGAHWESAFKCLLCTYHSHSRRSVTKHVTTVHMIPDGVKCSPSELMENETIDRQDELMALVRDCFPIDRLAKSNDQNLIDPIMKQHLSIMNHTNRYGDGDTGMTYDESTDAALPVETDSTFGHEQMAGKSSTTFGDDQTYAEENHLNQDIMPAFDVVEIDDEEYEDEPESGAWATNTNNDSPDERNIVLTPNNGIVDGWTVISKGTSPTKVPIYVTNDLLQGDGINHQAIRVNSTTRSNISNGIQNSNAPMLEALLRDFQFPTSSAEPVVTSVRSGPIQSQTDDDPRALINRLLDVVAPDVARFLLEEAIRDRANSYQAQNHQRNRSAQTGQMMETVMGTASIRSGGLIGLKATATTSRSAIMTVNQSIAPSNGIVITKHMPVFQNEGQRTSIAEPPRRDEIPGKVGPFKCDECDTLFKRRRYLERHVKSRHRMLCYRCTMPGCSFTNARELWYVRRHYAKYHANETRLVCRFCLKRFENSDDMTNRTHECCSLRSKHPKLDTANNDAQHESA